MVTITRSNKSKQSWRPPVKTLLITAAVIFVIIAAAINLTYFYSTIGSDSVASAIFSRAQLKKTQQEKPSKIAYAISLIKCGDHQSTPEGMLDAATVLRHSVHQTSSRNPASGSKYDYEMYALVHRQAETCSQELIQVGYKVLVVDPPVNPKDIRGEFLRNNIHSEWCCGSDEFIKLYAYDLTDHPLVVHLDLDFMMVKPMDILFDAMLSQGTNNPQRKSLLKSLWDRVELQYPEQNRSVFSLAQRNFINAAVTRDYPDIGPGRIPGFQAGFIVLRPNHNIVQQYVDFILEGNFVPGFEFLKNGWGGKGYGGFVGAKAMQGVVAYFYDIIQPQTSVELNSCRYNYMAADVKYREGGKSWQNKNRGFIGKCRSGQEFCEDCTQTDLSLVYNVHFTNCRKPWTCPSKGFNSRSGIINYDINPRLVNETKINMGGLSTYIDLSNTPYENCMKVHQMWHKYRSDLEDKLYRITKDQSIISTRHGEFEKEFYLGHCEDIGKYTSMNIYQNATLSRLKEIWI